MDQSSERYEALLEVLEGQAKRTAEERAAEARRTRRGGSWRYVLLGALLVGSLWLWVFPPTWLDAEPPLRPLAEEEAALRFSMYLQAQRIRAFELERGRAPVTLQEAGPPMEGMEYVRIDDSSYHLIGRTDRVTLTYRSTEPLREFVGSGADVVDEETLP